MYSSLWEILFLGLRAWKQLSSLFIKTACTLKCLPSGKLPSWLTLTWELIQAALVCGQGYTEQCVRIRLFHNTNWQGLLFWESCSAGIQAHCLTTDFQGVCPFLLNKHMMLESQGTTVHIYIYMHEKRTVPLLWLVLFTHANVRTFQLEGRKNVLFDQFVSKEWS